MTADPTPGERLFALIARIPGSGTVDWCDEARTLLDEIASVPAVLRWAADAIDAETRRLRADGVLEPDKYRPCRDASAQLRSLAAEPPVCSLCGYPITGRVISVSGRADGPHAHKDRASCRTAESTAEAHHP